MTNHEDRLAAVERALRRQRALLLCTTGALAGLLLMGQGAQVPVGSKGELLARSLRIEGLDQSAIVLTCEDGLPRLAMHGRNGVATLELTGADDGGIVRALGAAPLLDVFAGAPGAEPPGFRPEPGRASLRLAAGNGPRLAATCAPTAALLHLTSTKAPARSISLLAEPDSAALMLTDHAAQNGGFFGLLEGASVLLIERGGRPAHTVP